MRNLFLNILKSSKRKKWNENHISYWKKELILNDSGYSFFQNKLFKKLENILTDFGISFVTKITEHKDLEDENKIVKMITLTLDENSKFWIYHDMAEFDFKKKHQIYEEWGYLKPNDLINEYIKSILELLKNNVTE